MRLAQTMLAMVAMAALAPVAAIAQQKPETKAAPATARAEVIALEQRALQAFVKGDVAAWKQARGSSMIRVTAEGPITFDVDTLAAISKTCTTSSYVPSNFKATSSGNDLVILTYDARMNQLCGGNGGEESWHAMAVWQRQGERWITVAISMTPLASDLALEKQRVRQASDGVNAAEAARDIDKALSYYADDLIAHAAGAPPIVGKAAMRAFYQMALNTEGVISNHSTAILVAASGEMAWEHGVNTTTIKGPNGPVQDVGKYLAVWRKVNGAWKMAAVAATSDAPAAVPVSASLDAEKAALLALDGEWAKAAAENRDIERIVSFWADDAVVIPPGQPAVVGKQALREMVAATTRIPGFSVSWEEDQVNISPDGRMAYMLGRNRFTVPGASGQPVTTHGRGVTVWRKGADGTWKCVLDIWNDRPAGNVQ